MENTAPLIYNTQESNINNGGICIDLMSLVGNNIIGYAVPSFIPCWGCEYGYRTAERA